jgi:hypothetical protein
MELEPLPIGTSGRLQAVALANASGSHAVLVREAGEPRALLIGEPPAASRERLVVTPLDEDVEIRVDGDALAVWVGAGSLLPQRVESVPAWASAVGLVILLLMLGLALLGSLTFFGWLASVIG